MEDIARIEKYYFNNLEVQRRNNSIVMSLPEPVFTPFDEDTQKQIEEFFDNIRISDTVTCCQKIDGKDYPLIVERNKSTGEVVSIHP